ncbi:MAG TPA: hypothetical protein VLQ45_21775 [Thermoanaerobaculia bacterium]|nr:hypothetical protein [Thermoanaerobaculia bacterium]
MEKTQPVDFVRGEIGRAVRDLEAARDWLQGLTEGLPASEEEADPERDLATLDEAAGLRAVLQCVLRDHLGAAIKDRRSALEPEEEAEEASG